MAAAAAMAAAATFKSYLDDLNSSTSCCRSASLLIPRKGAHAILCNLRQWNWICASVLIRPWRSSDESSDGDWWYYQCLPSEDELLFLQRKYSQPGGNAHDVSQPSSPSLREELVRHHLESKSLIVPLTDDATAFILHVLFEMPVSVSEEEMQQYYLHDICNSEEQREKVAAIQEWYASNSMAIVHNIDGNQTVSLSKEVDLFPELLPPAPNNEHDTFTFVDLFAGIGGFRIGMEALGGKCIGSCEIDPYARDTYRHNFAKENECNGREFFVTDIARLEIPLHAVDVLCGGFPCQSFSTMASFSEKDRNTASGGKNRRQGGLQTPQKGKLFFHLLRILRKSQPKLFVFENVKGLLHANGGKDFETIIRLLKESGYHVTHSIVDTAIFLPQRRERVYFVGVRLDLLPHEEVPKSEPQSDLRRRYQLYNNDIPHITDMDKFDRVLLNSSSYPRKSSAQPLRPSRLGDILESSETVLSEHPHCFLTSSQWQNVRSQGYLQIHADGTGQLLTEDASCAQTLVSRYRQSYLMHSQFVVPRGSVYLEEQKERLLAEAQRRKGAQRMVRDAPTSAPTDANDHTLPRFFTPRECCRLQGFPEEFLLPFSNANDQRNLIAQFYRQIGNAVSPPCVAAVAEPAVSSFLLRKGRAYASGAVFDIISNASPHRAKVLDAIAAKSSFEQQNVSLG